MKFQVIVADCPWSFKDSLKMSDVKRSAQANYNTMTLQEIKDVPVNKFADPDGAILALWVPASLLQEGLDVMKAWGFRQTQVYVWVKTKKEPLINFKSWIKKSILKHPQAVYDDFAYKRAISCIIDSLKNISLKNDILNFGMGRLFRQTHELCLVGINNKKIYKLLKNKSQRSVCFAENLKHSTKPEDLQESLECMFPNTTKLELFARRHRPNWTCLGNELCNGEDINISLSKI